ncbi:MAG: cyclic nucleotide-binding domain-containing protein [Bacteroidota bacterium]
MELTALGYGVLTASALLVGALVGIYFRPQERMVAVVMAFGSGMLVSALAFDLIEEAFHKSGFWPLAVGFILGALLFTAFNHWLDQRGGYLRKPSTQRHFALKKKKERASEILGELSKVHILRSLPPEEVHAIVPFVESVHYSAGERIFEQGEKGDALYLMKSGEVNIVVRSGNRTSASATGEEAAETSVAKLGAGESFGEMALLTGETRSASAITLTDVELWRVTKQNFDHLIASSPRLTFAVSRLLAQRLSTTTLRRAEAEQDRLRWQQAAVANASVTITPTEERALVERDVGSKSAPLAIFLGVVLDGLPESLVIGASISPEKSMAFAFIVAVFISNLPEAMSSAAGMMKNKYSTRKILGLWGSLVVLSGIAALLGNIFLSDAPELILAIAESVAAGAILAMLADTMMPQAYEHGGPFVAMATVAGFLTAFFFNRLL